MNKIKLLSFTIIFIAPVFLYAQEDSISIQFANANHIKKRNTRILVAVNTGAYVGSMTALYQAWYKNFPQSKFHTFNDGKEWQQIDKIGHFYTAYTMSKYSMELWRNAPIHQRKRIWIGGISGAAYQTIIEILDGFSSEWGWSWSDISANLLGSGTLIAQELLWNEQKLHIKTSFHKNKYQDPSLNSRSNELFGHSLAERYLKDYNGQTYWISADLKSFFSKSKIPAWLQLSIGTGAEGIFGAEKNIAVDKAGYTIFYRPDIKRYRQWYLAPDVNLTKIKTRYKSIKTALFILNALKFPTPTVEFSNSSVKWKWIYF